MLEFQLNGIKPDTLTMINDGLGFSDLQSGFLNRSFNNCNLSPGYG